MKKPAFVFDGRNIIDHKKLLEIGFVVCSVGQKIIVNKHKLHKIIS